MRRSTKVIGTLLAILIALLAAFPIIYEEARAAHEADFLKRAAPIGVK